MKHWSIVPIDVDRHCCESDWVVITKKLRRVLEQHGLPFPLQVAAHFMRKSEPIKARTTAAVVDICDFLHSCGILFQISEVTPFSLARFRDKYQPAEQAAEPA